MKHFSKNIYLLRNIRGLTQAQIAAQLGFKSTTWNNYESGVSTPILRDALTISKFFEVSLNDLADKDLMGDVNLIRKYKDSKFWKKVNLNVNAIVNLIDEKEGKSTPDTKIEKAFNSPLNEDQTGFKGIERQLQELSNKVGRIEVEWGNKIAQMEDKIKALAKDRLKK